MTILKWLIDKKLVTTPQQKKKLHAFVAANSAELPYLAQEYFSSPIGDFGALDRVTRLQILQEWKPDVATLIKLYKVGHQLTLGVLVDLYVDLAYQVVQQSRQTDNQLTLQQPDHAFLNATMSLHLTAKSPLLLNMINNDSVLIKTWFAGSTQPADLIKRWYHNENIQPDYRLELICIAPHLFSTKDCSDAFLACDEHMLQANYTPIVSAKKEAEFPLATALIGKMTDVHAIKVFASNLEMKWLQEGQSRQTEVMLKSAKNRMLDILRQHPLDVVMDEGIAAFMKKYRVRHYAMGFFPVPNLFQTPSFTIYQQLCSRNGTAANALLGKQQRTNDADVADILEPQARSSSWGCW